MQKAAKTATLIVMWLSVALGVWVGILLAYFDIADPETFTKFEMIMSLFVSLHISEKICGFVFETQEETRKEGAENVKI